MSRVNSRQSPDILKVLDITLIIIFLAVVLSMIYSFYEPKLALQIGNRHLITDTKVIDELEECSYKYYDALTYEKTFIVNEMLTRYNQKSAEDIKKIKNEYNDILSYDLIVKKAYEVFNGVYICDLEIWPKYDAEKYNWDHVKTAQLVIKLNKNNNTFKIYKDDFKLS